MATYPPRDAFDVFEYDLQEVVDGYRSHNVLDPVPGDNHSAGFRWGFVNARKDATRVDDGFEHIRSDLIRMERFPN